MKRDSNIKGKYVYETSRACPIQLEKKKQPTMTDGDEPNEMRK